MPAPPNYLVQLLRGQGFCLQTAGFTQRGSLIGRLPGEFLLVAAEVPVCCRLLVDRTAQIERFDDPLGSQFEVFADCGLKFLVFHLTGAESLNEDADRLSYADGVRELHFDAISELRGNDVLGDVARHVASRTVDLRRIFSRKCSTAVTSHATVGVDDDLAAGESRIAHRPADDEA